MKPSSAKAAVKVAIKARRPVFLWGPPGVGKSQTVKQIAEGDGLSLVDIRAVLLDPVDLRGLPKIEDGRAVWCPPGFLPADGKGVLFLDELNAAPPLVQAGCYQLVLDRKIGEYILPPDWVIIAAGNRETDRAVTSRMPSALANRFVHIQFDVDVDDWVSWALDHGIMTEVIAFIRFRPGLLFQFDPAKNEKSFPTPRSWEFVSDLLKVGPDHAIEFDLLSGTVGEGAAVELLGFLKIFRTLPDPDQILMNPAAAPVPEDPATLYALSGALSRKAGPNSIGRIVEYCYRLPAEFSVLTIRDAVKIHPEVTSSRAFIDWAAKNQAVLF